MPSLGFSIADLVVAVNGVWILVETFMLKGELQRGPRPAFFRAPADTAATSLSSRREFHLEACALELPCVSHQ